MKAYISFFAIAAAVSLQIGCNSAAPVQTSNVNGERPVRSDQARQQNSIAHTTENPSSTPPPDPNKPGKFAQGGEAIDTAKFDGTIAEFEKAHKAKPDDATAKKNLVEAYFDRGFALTEARQYAAALGDYRRALKLDPNHEESKNWIEQITGIYKMLKKEAPKEGEEPPPLPFKKPDA